MLYPHQNNLLKINRQKVFSPHTVSKLRARKQALIRSTETCSND